MFNLFFYYLILVFLSTCLNTDHKKKQGVGIAFGPDVTQRWCEANKVSGVFRSHEVRQSNVFSCMDPVL